MLKNISFLALAGALAFATSLTACVVVTDDGTTLADTSTSGNTGDGDGDGDGATSGATTGDGDGDGDSATTGDGDGDGDGDSGDGDGDGDGDAGSCGWDANAMPPGYYCGGSGEDPGGTPIACPDGLVEGDPCGEVTGAGCCDGNGDNWYCGDDGMGNQTLVLEAC